MGNEQIQSVSNNQLRMREALKAAAVAGVLMIGAFACSESNKSEGDSLAADAVTAEIGESTSTTEFAFDGTVTDGSDAAIRAEDDANLYDCGGIKGETWKNPDGSNKPFNPNNLISHMTTHPELAKSDSDFWVDIFGAKALAFLGEKGIANKQHAEGHDIVADGLAPGYAESIAKLNSATLKVDAVSENYACKDAAGNYRVFPVNAKQLKAGETTLTGVALTKADYEAFVALAQEEGKDLTKVFVQEMDVDTDGDEEADTEVIMVFWKHSQCANNELKMPEAPKETTTTVVTTVNTTPRPTTPRVTSPTPTSPTPTNPTPTVPPRVEPKADAHPPVTGGVSTTVEAPQPGPDVPTASTTAASQVEVTTTQSTIDFTASTSTPAGGFNG